jgi:hypothetical protein
LNTHNSALNLHGVAARVATAFAPAQPLSAVPLPRSKAIPSQLTISGVVLFITCVLMFGSGFKALRPEIFGLLVHPFLIPLALAFPFIVVGSLKNFPTRALAALLLFFALYTLSNTSNVRAGLSEIIKISTALVAIICTALLIRSRGDFVAGVIGLGIASGAMGFYGMQGTLGSATGVEALDVGNKNAFSLFVLPSILLCGYMIFDMPVDSKPLRVALKTICVASIGSCTLAIFLSGNRSGYIGCVIIAAMLLKEKRLYGLLLVGMIAAAVVYIMISLEMTSVFQDRWNKTFVEKNASDEQRAEILLACFKIGLQYPITGVSTAKLPTEIGSYVGMKWLALNLIESHNVFAHVWAGAGMICFASLCYVGWTFWYLPPPRNKADLALAAEFKQAQRLLKMMVLLWMIRGNFTSSILYNPGFSIGLGLAIGYCALLAAKPKQGPQGGGVSAMPDRFAVPH